ncbi:MAG: methylenetetrahydrofolate reductase [NAD(P)H] [Actinomycetota bacterium]|nr:methylenetetrahydrofolate reductase [NAD(P)H] [Actinomycetota bacterium]MDH4016017.1 methylenetetrahydrofolate reductase [NAD(P)H] [Actinomycetota bacterium]
MDVPLSRSLTSGEPVFSFEFFPPKTDEGERLLWSAISDLTPLAPTFVSVTYGAGGSTRDRTVRITGRILAETGMDAVAHLTCVGATADELRDVLASYQEAGIHNLLALRGDPPGGPGSPWTATPGGLSHADELVALAHDSGDFTVGVAAFPEGHPESPDLTSDARVLAAKEQVGASFAISQFFFRTEDYFALAQRAAEQGVGMPILPGIMPVTNVRQIERFSVLSGAAFPEELAARFHAVADDAAAVTELGIEVATEQGAKLLAGGAPGLHFYTLNRSTATREILARLTG